MMKSGANEKLIEQLLETQPEKGATFKLLLPVIRVN
jgi:hypothetical protein